MTQELKRIVLAHHVKGAPSPDDFRIETAPIPKLEEGEFLVENAYVSLDPGTRSRLSPGASYAPPLQPGDTIDGFGVGEVVQSLNDAYPVGATVTLGSGWATHSISKGKGYVGKLPDLGVPLSTWIGVLGVPGMTAYFGLKRVAQIKPDARVLVTSAAGPVGATAGQLAKHWGASHVVGVAGGADKCAWITSEAGFDQAIDYKSVDLDAALANAFPKGIDVLFDNVGNAMIDRVLPLMRPGGRIIISGQVADYNLPPEDVPGIKNTREFIAKRLRMEGLVVFDDLREFPAAQAEVAGLIRDGALKYREDIVDELDAAPAAFCSLFTGAGFGRKLARLVPG
ncbi:MAG: NADP-dependent oxidoreductase [Pseudomonadota bacterium]